MADFDKALEKTLKWEGGYTVDTGGQTKYGISKNAYPNEDIPNLTLARAKELYRRDYWNPVMGDKITNQDSANAVFDFGVNAGISRVSKEVRAALNALGLTVPESGNIDQTVISKINQAGGALPAALSVRRVQFYKNLSAQNPAKYQKYLAGWLKRAKDFFGSSPKNSAFFALALVSLGAFLYIKKVKGKT